jgi:hypothetical protein
MMRLRPGFVYKSASHPPGDCLAIAPVSKGIKISHLLLSPLNQLSLLFGSLSPDPSDPLRVSRNEPVINSSVG